MVVAFAFPRLEIQTQLNPRTAFATRKRGDSKDTLGDWRKYPELIKKNRHGSERVKQQFSYKSPNPVEMMWPRREQLVLNSSVPSPQSADTNNCVNAFEIIPSGEERIGEDEKAAGHQSTFLHKDRSE